MLQAADFYNALAADYNAMTDAARQLDRDQRILRDLVRRLEIRRALEIGCGTGTQCFLLARLGVTMTGTDISDGMIAQARADAAALRLPVDFYVEDCAGDMHRPDTPYDAVFAIGNTLAHLSGRATVQRTLTNLRERLKPGGMVIIQLLNYERLLRTGDRIINIRRNGPATYVRFYDFCEDHLQFNILTINDRNGGPAHTLSSTHHTPWRRTDLEALAKPAGFSEVVACGSLQGDPYEPQASSNLVLLLR